MFKDGDIVVFRNEMGNYCNYGRNPHLLNGDRCRVTYASTHEIRVYPVNVSPRSMYAHRWTFHPQEFELESELNREANGFFD